MDVVVGGIYRHFKGHMYKVLCIGYDVDSPRNQELRKLVIYQNIESNEIWVRDYLEFLSKVDKQKYPTVLQEYRFELVNHG